MCTALPCCVSAPIPPVCDHCELAVGLCESPTNGRTGRHQLLASEATSTRAESGEQEHTRKSFKRENGACGAAPRSSGCLMGPMDHEIREGRNRKKH
jgi:hypothetical protein